MSEKISTEPLYERGGADLCDAIIHEETILAALNALFEQQDIKVVAIDGSFTAAKSVNLTVFLQKHNGELPDKTVVQSQLRKFGFEAKDYILVEAKLISEKNDLPCLALTFQGKESIELAKDKLPPLVFLEEKMQKAVAQASGMLAKVRLTAAGLFSAKKSSSSSGTSIDPTHDAAHKGPHR